MGVLELLFEWSRYLEEQELPEMPKICQEILCVVKLVGNSNLGQVHTRAVFK